MDFWLFGSERSRKNHNVKNFEWTTKLIPFVAYFIQSGWQWMFGLMPTFWPLKLYWLVAAGQPYGWLIFISGLVFELGLLWIVSRRFNTIMRR